MKRKELLSALLALSMVIPLASCGSIQQNDDRQNTSRQDSTVQQSSQPDDSQQDSDTSVSRPAKPDTAPDHTDTQPKIVFDKGGKTFYAGKFLYSFTDGAEDADVVLQSPDDSGSYFTVRPKSMALCGADIYCPVNGSRSTGILHVYADDTGAMHEDVLYTPDQLKPIAEKHCDKDIAAEEIKQAAESDYAIEVRYYLKTDYEEQYEKPYEQTESRPDDLPSYSEFEAEHFQEYYDRYRDSYYQQDFDRAEKSYWDGICRSLCFDIVDPIDGGDGYIYASLRFNRNRRLIRFAKDGSSYEIFEDIILSSFAFNDGWLYYYDSGAEQADIDGKQSYDAKRRGIYKMRLDGSEKKELCGGITMKIGGTSWYGESEYSKAVIKMRVAGNCLYYLLANEESRNYHLYRMPLDSDTPELCVPINCCGYTLDDSGNTLCYYGCEENLPLDEEPMKEHKDKVKLVLKNLLDGTEKIISTSQIVCCEYDDEMQIFGDTLYVSSDRFRDGTDIDTSENGYILEFTSEGQMLRITEPEYRINQYARAGLRIGLTDGKTEWLLRYRFCNLSSDSFEAAIEEAKKPWQTIWKDADKMEEEINDIIKKYNIDVNYQEPPAY